MSAPAAVAVVIPARDEEELLASCLSSVVLSAGVLAAEHPHVELQIFVVLDSCHDASADIVAQYEHVEAVVVQLGCVGAARAAGVEAAAERNSHREASRLWIANTDADSTVPASWLTSQVACAKLGHELVVGMVVPNPGDLTVDELIAWRSRHRVSDGHNHVYGANLGFSLSAYRRAGGFPPLGVHEDVGLVSAMKATGVSGTAPAEPRVVTSGRHKGRTPEGFATYLTRMRALEDLSP